MRFVAVLGNRIVATCGTLPPIRLVVGLGNPGRGIRTHPAQYRLRGARSLAAERRVPWERSEKWGAYWAKRDDVLLVKPTRYMNRSGEPLLAIAQFYKIAARRNAGRARRLGAALGRLRFRPKAAPAGTTDWSRSSRTSAPRRSRACGSGSAPRPAHGAVDYVLGRFFEEEMPIVEKAIERAAEAVKCAIDKGVVSAMNTFNKTRTES